MGHVHTKSNSYVLTRVTDQIILMSLSGVCLECRLRIQPILQPYSRELSSSLSLSDGREYSRY